MWQIFFVLNFPDTDTDAYVHHVIARQIIMSPGDLSIHWVWLPAFHYLSAGAILIGAGMQAIRFCNVLIWFSIPALLFFFLYKNTKDNNLFIAFFSALLCGLFPIGILMGTTAQPEPIFTLLILLFIITYKSGKYIVSSVVLSVACLMRYEAWAVLAAVFTIYIIDIFRERKLIFDLKALTFFIPALSILLWAILRLPFDGKLFGFLSQTQQFANDALKENNSFQGGFFKIIKDFLHYPVVIPVLFSGLNILFLPFGIKSLYKNNKLLFYSGTAILAFITLSWMLKSNLGLNRHFVSVIPLYSVLTAYGILNVSKYLQVKKRFKNLNVKKLLLLIIFITSLSYLTMWLYIWQVENKAGFPERKSAVEYFKSIDDGKTIFCNDAVFEILSGLDMKRFNHVWMENNPAALETIKKIALQENYVYLITSEDKIHNVSKIGKVIYSSPLNAKTGMSVIIMKVEGNTKN